VPEISSIPAYLRTELIKPAKLEAAEMPALHALHEEIIRVTQLTKTRSTLIAVALAAVIIGAFALVGYDGRPSPKLTAPSTERAESRELVDRLLRQVEALENENRVLTEGQQQAAHAIATLEAERDSRKRVSSVHWNSDLAALSLHIEKRRDPWGVVPLRPSNAPPAAR
jgi:hypothetical protein